MKLPAILLRAGMALSTAGLYLFFSRVFKKKKKTKKVPAKSNTSKPTSKKQASKPRQKRSAAIAN